MILQAIHLELAGPYIKIPSTQGLIKVLDDVFHIFYTYREADEPGRDTCCCTLFVALVGMDHRSGMRNQGLHSTQAYSQQANLCAFNRLVGSSISFLHFEG